MIIEQDTKLEVALFERHSVRSFQDKELGKSVVNMLRSEISYLTTHESAIHFQLFLDNEDPFAGFKSSYGIFRNARNFIACVVDTSYENCMQHAGFCAELIALKAVANGLGTCFVGGTYNSNNVPAQMRVTWAMPFILLLGYPEEDKTPLVAKLLKRMARSSHKPTPQQVLANGSLPYSEIEQRWPALIEGLRAVATSPSSLNRHPVRIKITENDGSSLYPNVTALCTKEYAQSDIDLGIALANWQVAIGGEWIFGPQPKWIYP